jgi:tRNA threonylcarbamoyl adenosine modification protein YjeE
MHLSLPTIGDTERLAARVAAHASPGDFIGLSGPLGAGKTAFARAFLAAMAARRSAPAPAEVPSPTFTLVQSYELGGVEVVHFDLYRIRSSDEAAELGLDEAQERGVVVVEWPERLGERLPKNRLDIALSVDDADARAATVTGQGSWRARAAAL